MVALVRAMKSMVSVLCTVALQYVYSKVVIHSSNRVYDHMFVGSLE